MIEIYIMGYEIFLKCIDDICDIPFNVIIFDEIHKALRNNLTLSYQAVEQLEQCKRLIGLSGTVIQNNLLEFYNVVNLFYPGCLGTESEFKARGEAVLAAQQKNASTEKEAEYKAGVAIVHEQINDTYLRRSKSVNPHFDTIKKIENVVFCNLTKVQQNVYLRALDSKDFQYLKTANSFCSCSSGTKDRFCCQTGSGGIIHASIHESRKEKKKKCPCPDCIMLACISQLLKISCHLDLVKYRNSSVVKYQREFTEVIFGADAKAIGGLDFENQFSALSKPHSSGKLLALEKMLRKWTKEKKKTIIFSNFTTMLDILQHFVLGQGYAFRRLDGKTPIPDRQLYVNEFNSNSNIHVFLISTKAGGTGLNITGATKVVLFDPSWNPANDLQAQDRAYRIGQTKNVEVYRLISVGTIEEFMYTRQIYKQQSSNALLEKEQGPRYFTALSSLNRGRQKTAVYGELFGILNLLRYEPDGFMRQIKEDYLLAHGFNDGVISDVHHEADLEMRQCRQIEQTHLNDMAQELLEENDVEFAAENHNDLVVHNVSQMRNQMEEEDDLAEENEYVLESEANI